MRRLLAALKTSLSALGRLAPATALPALSALLFLLTFPAPGLRWLAWVCLVPLTLTVHRSTLPTRSKPTDSIRGPLAQRLRPTLHLALITLLAFLPAYLLLQRWMIPVTLGGYLALSTYMAVWTTSSVLTLRLLRSRTGLPFALLLPLAWTTFDFLREQGPFGGYAWFFLAHTQAATSPNDDPAYVAFVASLFGQNAITFYLTFFNGFVADLLAYFRQCMSKDASNQRAENKSIRKFHLRTVNRRTVFSYLGITLCLSLITGIYLPLFFYSAKAGFDPPPTLALIQTDLPQSNKDSNDPETLALFWRDLLGQTRDAALNPPAPDLKPDLIVWPETAIPGPTNDAFFNFAQRAWPYQPEALQIYLRRSMAYRTALEGFQQQDATAGLANPAALQNLANHNARPGLATELNTPLLVGGPARDIEQDTAHNSAFLILPDTGYQPTRYDKTHRVPFGEYIPGPAFLKALVLNHLSPYDFDYSLTPGSGPVVFTLSPGNPNASKPTDSIRGFRFATPICFEDTVPRLTRRMALAPDGSYQIDALINLTNDGWFATGQLNLPTSEPDPFNPTAPDATPTLTDRLANLYNNSWLAASHQPQQHLQIASLRCIELGIPMARSVNRGISAMIDAQGHITAIANPATNAPGIVYAKLPPARTTPTLYARLGDWPMWILTLTTFTLVILTLLPKRKRKPKT